MSTDLADRLDAAVKTLSSRAPSGFVPRVGVVLGSGLGAFGDALQGCAKIPYADVGFPSSAIVGHAGNLCLGTVGARPPARRGRDRRATAPPWRPSW